MSHPVQWFELLAETPERREALIAFYRDLFSWQVRIAPHNGYAFVHTGAPGGIQGGIGVSDHTGREGAVLYVECQDLKGSYERALRLGGRGVLHPQAIDGFPIALVEDPNGNLLGLIAARTELPATKLPKVDAPSRCVENVFRVNDLEKSVAFYERLTGIVFERWEGSTDNSETSMWASASELGLHLAEVPGYEANVANGAYIIIPAILTEASEMMKKVMDAGGTVHSFWHDMMPSRLGKDMLYVQDPDGYRVALRLSQ